MKSIWYFYALFTLFLGLTSFVSMWFLIGNLALLLIYFLEIYNNTDSDNMDDTIFGFSLLPVKKIHTEWGCFFIKLVYKNSQHYVYLYVVEGIFVERIDYWPYSDIESMKSRINSKVEYRYGYRKSIDKVKKDVWDDWNGYTSVQLERDKKLEDLTK
jgi:CDP-diglyceride synthetase